MEFNYGMLVPLSFIMGTISWRFLIATVFLENFKSWPIEKIIMPFICIHLFRYISISLMIPGLTSIGEILPFYDVLRLTLFDVACSILSMLSLFFLHKKADNFDPESSYSSSNFSQGVLFYALPTTRSLGLSLNVKF